MARYTVRLTNDAEFTIYADDPVVFSAAWMVVDHGGTERARFRAEEVRYLVKVNEDPAPNGFHIE